jgi:hypothetical protein
MSMALTPSLAEAGKVAGDWVEEHWTRRPDAGTPLLVGADEESLSSGSSSGTGSSSGKRKSGSGGGGGGHGGAHGMVREDAALLCLHAMPLLCFALLCLCAVVCMHGVHSVRGVCGPALSAGYMYPSIYLLMYLPTP